MDLASLKKTLKSFKENNVFEFNKVIKAIETYTPSDGSILDVGCGYGRYLKPLSKKFKNVVGVEANDHIVKTLTKEKFKVYSPEAFSKSKDMFDAIIMSHFIEHFTPSDLLEIMDGYLDRLKPGGVLVIATPVLNENFYIDFDHVRPYYPQSIEEVFGGKGEQVQYYSRNTLETLKVWFRRSRLQILRTSLLFNNKWTKNLIYLMNILLAFLFRFSFSLVGYRSGWIGVFKKL
jgi:SAM-dependent methyltransferase